VFGVSDKPTPAEAMALWHSLRRPSGHEVAKRFTAAGRPITQVTIAQWQRRGWQPLASAPRADSATPAEAQALWESLDKPSCEKVAAALRAQGRQVCGETIRNWRRAGWSGATVRVFRTNSEAAGRRAAVVSARTAGATSPPGTQGAAPRQRGRRAAIGNRPTVAEAMALYYSLDRPTATEVARRFAAAGRTIQPAMITLWKRQDWPGVANAPKYDKPTPAQAKAMWESLETPSLDTLADAFKAQGRPISASALGRWKQAGWSRVTPKNALAKVNKAMEKLAAELPALTGDPMSTLTDILPGKEVVPDGRSTERSGGDPGNDTCSPAAYTEHALLRAIRTATAVNDAIHEVAAAVPKAADLVSKDAPLPMLLERPEGIARLMMASNAGIGVTIEGMLHLPALRAEAAAAIPGTQTVYPPEEGRSEHAAKEALDEVMEKIREKRRRDFELSVQKNESEEA
jgi:hypothetical protein